MAANAMLNATPSAASFATFDQRAAAGERMSVVFFGGSLTWGANASDPQRTSYRARMSRWLQEKYPRAPFTFHDAAIGGTGSKLGMFRLDRDVLAYSPDLVFLDFTLNDGLQGTDQPSLASYETLLRSLIGRGIPVEQLFFAGRDNFGDHWTESGPPRVVAHRALAAAYQTAMGDVYPILHARLMSGQNTAEEIWPLDGVHPFDTGYEIFFEAARLGLEQAIASNRICQVPDRPVFDEVYTFRKRSILSKLPLPNGWKLSPTYRTSMWFDGLSSRFLDDVIVFDSSEQPTAQPIRFEFKGTMLGILGEADQDSLSFMIYIDGQPLRHSQGDAGSAEIWPFNTRRFGAGRLFQWRQLSDALSPGPHTLELVPVLPKPGEPHGQLRIESICVAGND